MTHGSLIFIEVFKIYKLLNLLKLEKLFFVGSPIVTTLGGSWAVITAIYMVLFGLNFGQNRPFFALQKSNFGFAFENERTVRIKVPIEENSTDTSMVSVRLYALPIEEWSQLPRKVLRNDLHVFDGYTVSFLRNDREVQAGTVSQLVGTRHSDHAWLRLQIDFSGELDEAFGVAV